VEELQSAKIEAKALQARLKLLCEQADGPLSTEKARLLQEKRQASELQEEIERFSRLREGYFSRVRGFITAAGAMASEAAAARAGLQRVYAEGLSQGLRAVVSLARALKRVAVCELKALLLALSLLLALWRLLPSMGETGPQPSEALPENVQLARHPSLESTSQHSSRRLMHHGVRAKSAETSHGCCCLHCSCDAPHHLNQMQPY
jgi:hypothetical protein